ncbi:amidohydrolase family protein [Candidatus Poribacteria bacterium]|nr:amidohydrolase family protein [Candidatus Poribacteria bacterium]
MTVYRKFSRREVVKVISASALLPILLDGQREGFAADHNSKLSMNPPLNENHPTHFVDDYIPRADSRVELKNGRFVDVINGRYFEAGTTVVVERGKIVEICGPQDHPGAVKTDFSIDLEGKTVMPALLNTHCHIGMTFPSRVMTFRDVMLTRRYHEQQIAYNMTECLAHGITNIRDVWIPDLRTTRSLKEKISRGTMRGPRILQSVVVGPPGGYFTGNVGSIDRFMQSLISFPFVDYEKTDAGSVLFPVDATEQQVRDAVDRAMDERGADCIKIGEQRENMVDYKPTLTIMTKSQLAAIGDQARKRGLKSTIHHVSVESFRRAVECGISSLAHAPFDDKLTAADIEAFNSSGCFIEPTATVAYDLCWRIKGDAMYDHPQMVRLTRFRAGNLSSLAGEYWMPGLSRSVMSASNRIAEGKLKSMGLFDVRDFYKYFSTVIADGADNVRMLYESGADMAAGNDGGVPMGTPAMIGHELSMLDFSINIDSDSKKFRGADAVRTATLNSARALGLDDRFGSIEVSKIADLAIVDGDPLEDLHVIGARVAALFMDGKLVIDNYGLRVDHGDAAV